MTLVCRGSVYSTYRVYWFVPGDVGPERFTVTGLRSVTFHLCLYSALSSHSFHFVFFYNNK